MRINQTIITWHKVYASIWIPVGTKKPDSIEALDELDRIILGLFRLKCGDARCVV